jgi:hypothetical protein
MILTVVTIFLVLHCSDPFSPRIGELDGSDFGQNINAHGSANLIDHLLLGKGFCVYPILIQRSPSAARTTRMNNAQDLINAFSVVKTVALVAHTDEFLHTERYEDVDSAAGIFTEDAKEYLLRELPTEPLWSGK